MMHALARPFSELAALAVSILLGGVAAAAPQKVVDYELQMEGWADDVRPSIAIDGALSPFAKYVKHDVLGFRLEYTSMFRGQEVTVSGLVVVPIDIDTPMPILVWNHGTLFDENSAPSSWRNAAQLQLMPALAGMIVFMPDYVGYGASGALVHPYILRDDLVASVIDMIHAGRAFLREQEMLFSDELLLWGFSEGGFVSLATGHELDTNASHGIEVSEIHAVSGPYDLLQASSVILADDSYPIPSYVALLFAAYNERYWKRPASDFFVEPFADVVERFLARDAKLGALGSSMPPTLGGLLSPTFAASFEGDGEVHVKDALAANAIPAWAPSVPVVLYHGTADVDVPFTIGRQQYEAMIAAGAESSRLRFVDYAGANHTATIIEALQTFLGRP